jgi:hypothetical protein
MNSLKLYKSCYQSPFLPNLHKKMVKQTTVAPNKLVHGRKLAVRACGGLEPEKNSERRSFLSLEEAGLVEMSGISTHERFLCRLTVFLS